jgi:hypothetical protein
MAPTKRAGASRQTRIDKAFKSAFRRERSTGGEDAVKIRVCAGSTCNASASAKRVRSSSCTPKACSTRG